MQKVGFLGPIGGISHCVARSFFPGCQILPFTASRELEAALKRDDVSNAVFRFASGSFIPMWAIDENGNGIKARKVIRRVPYCLFGFGSREDMEVIHGEPEILRHFGFPVDRELCSTLESSLRSLHNPAVGLVGPKILGQIYEIRAVKRLGLGPPTKFLVVSR